MLKLIGILMLVSVSTLYGLRASANLKIRKNKLGQYIKLIGEIEDKIRQKKGLYEIFSSEFAVRLTKYENFSVRFQRDGLNDSDTEILKEFFSLVGFGDIKSQIELCRTYGELLGKKEKEAEHETAQKAKLYSLLGLFCGLFVAVLLI